MRTLIITPIPLIPTNEGNRVRIHAMIRVLQDLGHDIWILGLGLSLLDARAMKEVWGNRFSNAPRLSTSAIRPRWSSAWRLLLAIPEYLEWICPPIDFWYQPQWNDALQELKSRVRFDNVIVSYIFFSRALCSFGCSVQKIIDTHDVFTERDRKLKAVKAGARWYRARRGGERRALSRADSILAIQEKEADFFRKLLGPKCHVAVCGHIVKVAEIQLPPAPGTTVGYLGASNPMNQRAIEWFLERCWKPIRENVQNARLLIGGGIVERLQPRKLRSMSIVLRERIETIEEFYSEVSVVINPSIGGTGLKIKSIEALGFGRPLVCSVDGAMGLEPSKTAFLIGENADEFQKKVVQLLRNPQLAQSASYHALRYARRWNETQLRSLTEMFTERRAGPLLNDLYIRRAANWYI